MAPLGRGSARRGAGKALLFLPAGAGSASATPGDDVVQHLAKCCRHTFGGRLRFTRSTFGRWPGHQGNMRIERAPLAGQWASARLFCRSARPVTPRIGVGKQKSANGLGNRCAIFGLACSGIPSHVRHQTWKRSPTHSHDVCDSWPALDFIQVMFYSTVLCSCRRWFGVGSTRTDF